MITLTLNDGAVRAGADAPAETTFADWAAGGYGTPAHGAALVLANDLDLSSVDPRANFSLFGEIIVHVPTFKDGRAYSQVRRLREQYGFDGVVRVRGDVLRDQVQFMARVGVTAVDVADDAVGGVKESARDFSVFYQASVRQYGADRAGPIWRRRAARALAA
ncbi:MAG: DUF934 domain-containing protein [Pseudomonadota bacterium]